MKYKNTNIKVVAGDVTMMDSDVLGFDVDAPSPMDQEKVRSACANALIDAVNSNANSIWFPPLGVKTGFPLIGSAKIMTQEFLKHLKGTTTLKEISVCLEKNDDAKVFEEAVFGYIKHLEEDLGGEPYKTVDIIIELPEGIILIERSFPPYGWALPGGFLDPGEELKDAAIREAKEETNMDLEDVEEFKTYDQPGRDPRFETHSTVFIAKGIGQPQFGDDAKGLKIIKYKELLSLEYAFDHHQVIQEYLDNSGAGQGI